MERSGFLHIGEVRGVAPLYALTIALISQLVYPPNGYYGGPFSSPLSRLCPRSSQEHAAGGFCSSSVG